MLLGPTAVQLARILGLTPSALNAQQENTVCGSLLFVLHAPVANTRQPAQAHARLVQAELTVQRRASRAARSVEPQHILPLALPAVLHVPQGHIQQALAHQRARAALQVLIQQQLVPLFRALVRRVPLEVPHPILLRRLALFAL